MRRLGSSRRPAWMACAALACAASAVACVDLFHSTDFTTLCDVDAAACATDAAPVEAAHDGGVDAARPHPDFCAWSPDEAREHAARACAWLGACEKPLGDAAFGACMVRAVYAYDCEANPSMRPAGEVDALWACLDGVQSCGDVDACVFGGTPPVCQGVASGSFTTCSGAARLECGSPTTGPAVGVEPCAMSGRTCTRRDQSIAECTGAQGTSCFVGATCDGTALVSCEFSGASPVDHGVDCAGFGDGRCVADDDGGATGCAPERDAPSCDGGAKVVCTGSVASTCIDGRTVSFDCAALDVPCEVTASTPGWDPLAACARSKPPDLCFDEDACEGSTLTSCARGGSFQVDCEAVGLGACQKPAPGAAAFCSPP